VFSSAEDFGDLWVRIFGFGFSDFPHFPLHTDSDTSPNSCTVHSQQEGVSGHLFHIKPLPRSVFSMEWFEQDQFKPKNILLISSQNVKEYTELHLI
jgi:hypothetical protein